MRFVMLHRLVALVFLVLSFGPFIAADEYLVVASGKKYLGKVSGADKTKFIFCDSRVGVIPTGAHVETTPEKCGGQPVLSIPMDNLKFRLLTISEGAAYENDQALAKDALNAVVELQQLKGGNSEQKAKAEVDRVEARAGGRLGMYVAKGEAALKSTEARRP